jgi:ankyrin repeat protein
MIAVNSDLESGDLRQIELDFAQLQITENYSTIHQLAHIGATDLFVKHASRLNINNTVSETGDTALHIAMRRGHVKFAVELLRRGANIDQTNQMGKTCTQYATDTVIRNVIKSTFTVPNKPVKSPKKTVTERHPVRKQHINVLTVTVLFSLNRKM